MAKHIPLRDLKAVSLFAGIGGLELGLSKCGYDPVLMADKDLAAQAVLRVRFPNADIYGDVASVHRLPKQISLLTAGFPCQDLSMAGSKRGLLGRKSSAVSRIFELLSENPVPTVLIENVYFMLHLGKGAAIQSLVSAFEKLRYRWAYRVVDTRAFGLPQRRRRVFLVASLNHDPGEVLFGDDAGKQCELKPSLEEPIGFYWTEGSSGHGLTRNAIPPLKAGSAIGIASPPAVLFPDGRVVRPTIATAERLQGFPIGWTKPAEAIGAGRERWRLVGNAVSVPVAEWLGNRLRHPSKCRVSSIELDDGAPWPTAAFGEGGRRWVADISEWPLNRKMKSLSSFESTGWDPLSFRALRGFTTRARASSLRYPPGFLDSLERNLLVGDR